MKSIQVESKKTPIDHEEEAEKRQDEASQISILIAENQAFEYASDELAVPQYARV